MPDSECCMILWLSFSELWFGLGKCHHHRRCDPVIQCVLTRQPQLHRTASGIRRQTPAGVLSSFPYTWGRQQRYPWPQLKWQGEKAPSATCGALFIVNNCREKPRWRYTFCRGGGTGIRETQTHLYFVLAGHHECLEILISWGIDVDQDIPHLGTPLYVASMSQQFHCVRKLLYTGNFLYNIFHSVRAHKQLFSSILISVNKHL